MVIDVDFEVNKYKNCKDRDELTRLIKEYKNLAMQNAEDFSTAGKYNSVAFKLQEICDKLPPPNLKNPAASRKSAPTKTANLTKEERARIESEWEKKAKR
ncbi:hypothetical protein R84B8_02268 [Treponema sp. R8-4-B8]